MGNEKSCYSIIPAPGAEARKCGGLRHFRRTPSAPGFSKEQSKGYGLAPAPPPHNRLSIDASHRAKALAR